MPTPSTRQTQMNIHMGKAPAVDGDHFIDDISYKRNVVGKATDYTVLATDSGTLFHINGATADVEFTLPAFSDGLEFEFFHNGTDSDIELKVSTTGNNLVGENGLVFKNAAFTTTQDAVGGSLLLTSSSAQWFARCLSNQVVTYATA